MAYLIAIKHVQPQHVAERRSIIDSGPKSGAESWLNECMASIQCNNGQIVGV